VRDTITRCVSVRDCITRCVTVRDCITGCLTVRVGKTSYLTLRAKYWSGELREADRWLCSVCGNGRGCSQQKGRDNLVDLAVDAMYLISSSSSQ
jgi:hypothetical protein